MISEVSLWALLHTHTNSQTRRDALIKLFMLSNDQDIKKLYSRPNMRFFFLRVPVNVRQLDDGFFYSLFTVLLINDWFVLSIYRDA